MAQVVESLTIKCEALSSNPSTAKGMDGAPPGGRDLQTLLQVCQRFTSGCLIYNCVKMPSTRASATGHFI
jgi:hypothetical protein